MYSRSSTPDVDWMAESEDEILGCESDEEVQSENEAEANESNSEEETNYSPPIVMQLVAERTLDTPEPDVHFQVFSQVFHLHSMVLKQHSGFFKTFLESPEKKGWIDKNAKFPYRWVSLVDDDGTWAMVWDDPNKVWKLSSSLSGTSDIDLQEIVSEKLPFELSNQVHAFKTLIDSFYGKKITLRSINHLQILTEMADYYDSLPIVRFVTETAVSKSVFWSLDIESNAIDLLPIAYTLQNKVLWKECLIYLVGAWRTPLPHFETQSDSNQRILAVMKRVRTRLQNKLRRLHHHLLWSLDEPSKCREVGSVFSAWVLDDYSRFLVSFIPFRYFRHNGTFANIFSRKNRYQNYSSNCLPSCRTKFPPKKGSCRFSLQRC